MATYYPLVQRKAKSNFGGPRAGRQIEGAVIHHAATTDAWAYVSGYNNRNSHPTYHINRNGVVGGVVHPDKRPFSTAHTVDFVAVAFELDNSRAGGEWPVADVTLDACIEVMVHHMRETGRTTAVINTPGRDQPGKFFVAWHSQYKSTACPGPYLTEKMQWIVDELNRRVKGNTSGGKTPAAPGGKTPAAPGGKTPAPKRTTFVRAPGGETGSPKWPKGPLMERIQRALADRERYDGKIDGIGSTKTAKGVQITLNYSQLNGVKPYVKTVVDGKLGINNAYGVQHYAAKYGDYTGPIDGDPLTKSWTGFALGLERP